MSKRQIGYIGVREARRLARQYVGEWLRSDDAPEWIYEHISADDDKASLEFMAELQRIAARFLKSSAPPPHLQGRGG